MKTRPKPRFVQPDFIGTEHAFNLFSETTLDGERLRREAQAAERTAAEAKALEEQRQRRLIFTAPLT